MKIHKSSSSSSFSEITPAGHQNSFSAYALSKSAAAHSTGDTFDIDDEPTLHFPSISTFVAPPPLPPSTRESANHNNSAKFKSPSHPSRRQSRRVDLAAARRDYEQCRTEALKTELKARLNCSIVRRLKELSEMEATSNAGIEIADSVDFLKLLNQDSDSALKEIGEIRDKSREGVVRLQEGQLLVKRSQDQLRSALRNNFLFSVE